MVQRRGPILWVLFFVSIALVVTGCGGGGKTSNPNTSANNQQSSNQNQKQNQQPNQTQQPSQTQQQQQQTQQLLAQADVTADPTQRLKMYNQAEQQLVNDVAWLPIFQQSVPRLVKTYVIGRTFNAFDVVPPDAWASVYIAQH